MRAIGKLGFLTTGLIPVEMTVGILLVIGGQSRGVEIQEDLDQELFQQNEITIEEDVHVFETLVVTATRREEDAQEIPASLTVVQRETVESLRVKTINDLQFQVPNLFIDQANANHTPFVFIRGIGLTDFNQNAQGSVGIYRDEIYQNNAALQLNQLFDLEQVEVLRGPQADLYGRNTTGGAIRFIPKKPTGQPNAQTRMTLGTFDGAELELATGGPLSDNLYARVAGIVNTRDGVLKNQTTGTDVNDTKNWAGRALFNFLPTINQSWLLKVHGGAVDETGRAPEGSDPTLFRVKLGTPWKEFLTEAGTTNMGNVGGSLTGTIEMDDYEFLSITGFEYSDRLERVDIDASALPTLVEQRTSTARQWTQEFRILSLDETRFEWLLGVNGFFENLEASTELEANNWFASTFFSDTNYTQDNYAASTFGHVSFDLNDRLILEGGARFSWERKDFETSQEGFFFAPFSQSRQDDDWSEPSGTASLLFKLTDGIRVYAKYSHGFRSGGFNAGGNVDDPSFEPEFVDSYELGLKTEYRYGTLNISGFYAEYEDMQVLSLVNVNNAPLQFLTNAAKSRINGLEAELVIQPHEWVTIKTGLGLLDTEFLEFIDDQGINRDGNRLTRAPQTMFNGVAQTTIPLPNGGSIISQLDWSYTSKLFFDVANTDRIAEDGYWLLGFRTGYVSSKKFLEIMAWGRNVTDEIYFTTVSSIGTKDIVWIGDPAMFGVDLILHY